MMMAAAAMAAPVEPAETRAAASACSTKRAATLIEESGFSRRARAGSSDISIDWLAGTIGSSEPSRASSLAEDGRVADQDHVDTIGSCELGSGHDLGRGSIAAHGVKRDRAHSVSRTSRPR